MRRLRVMDRRTPVGGTKPSPRHTAHSGANQYPPRKKNNEYLSDMIRLPSRELLPISRLPNPEALHVLIIVAHGALLLTVKKRPRRLALFADVVSRRYGET